MRFLELLPGAANDLRRLHRTDPAVAAAVLVALEQIEADPDAIDKLTLNDTSRFGAFRLGIKRWESARRVGNLWRFRLLDTPATRYRVIYGYHWQTRQVAVLAVVHKETFDYDDLSSEIARRILADWRSL